MTQVALRRHESLAEGGARGCYSGVRTDFPPPLCVKQLQPQRGYSLEPHAQAQRKLAKGRRCGSDRTMRCSLEGAKAAKGARRRRALEDAYIGILMKDTHLQTKRKERKISSQEDGGRREPVHSCIVDVAGVWRRQQNAFRGDSRVATQD